MDRLAACHLMHGFLHVPGSGRGHHASAPNCQHVKRSLSLMDRRGLISPARGSARGLISPAHAATGRGRSARMLMTGGDDWEALARRMHGHSLTHMHDMSMLMQTMAERRHSKQILLPTLGFSDGEGEGSARSARRGRSVVGARREWAWRREHLGQVLVSLRYSPASSQLSVGIVRAIGLRAEAPFLTVWLLRGQGLPATERRKSSPRGAQQQHAGGAMAPMFDEQFVFECQPTEMDNLTLVVTVMDSTGGGENVEVGHCILGELGADEAGERHWRETLGRPERTSSQWHRLSADW